MHVCTVFLLPKQNAQRSVFNIKETLDAWRATGVQNQLHTQPGRFWEVNVYNVPDISRHNMDQQKPGMLVGPMEPCRTREFEWWGVSTLTTRLALLAILPTIKRASGPHWNTIGQQ